MCLSLKTQSSNPTAPVHPYHTQTRGGGGKQQPAQSGPQAAAGTIQDGVRLQTAEERRAGNEGDAGAIERGEVLRAEAEERRRLQEADAARAADEEAAVEMELEAARERDAGDGVEAMDVAE